MDEDNRKRRFGILKIDADLFRDLFNPEDDEPGWNDFYKEMAKFILQEKSYMIDQMMKILDDSRYYLLNQIKSEYRDNLQRLIFSSETFQRRLKGALTYHLPYPDYGNFESKIMSCKTITIPTHHTVKIIKEVINQAPDIGVTMKILQKRNEN